MSQIITYSLMIIVLFMLKTTFSAGYGNRQDTGPEGHWLHLEKGEYPRNLQSYGGGLHNITLTADVVVAGGGSAGISAAIASARNGAKTIIITTYYFPT